MYLVSPQRPKDDPSINCITGYNEDNPERAASARAKMLRANVLCFLMDSSPPDMAMSKYFHEVLQERKELVKGGRVIFLMNKKDRITEREREMYKSDLVAHLTVLDPALGELAFRNFVQVSAANENYSRKALQLIDSGEEVTLEPEGEDDEKRLTLEEIAYLEGALFRRFSKNPAWLRSPEAHSQLEELQKDSGIEKLEEIIHEKLVKGATRDFYEDLRERLARISKVISNVCTEKLLPLETQIRELDVEAIEEVTQSARVGLDWLADFARELGGEVDRFANLGALRQHLVDIAERYKAALPQRYYANLEEARGEVTHLTTSMHSEMLGPVTTALQDMENKFEICCQKASRGIQHRREELLQKILSLKPIPMGLLEFFYTTSPTMSGVAALRIPALDVAFPSPSAKTRYLRFTDAFQYMAWKNGWRKQHPPEVDPNVVQPNRVVIHQEHGFSNTFEAFQENAMAIVNHLVLAAENSVAHCKERFLGQFDQSLKPLEDTLKAVESTLSPQSKGARITREKLSTEIYELNNLINLAQTLLTDAEKRD